MFNIGIAVVRVLVCRFNDFNELFKFYYVVVVTLPGVEYRKLELIMIKVHFFDSKDSDFFQLPVLVESQST